MFYFNKVFVLCLIAIVANGDDSYCNPKICPLGLKHVACGVDLKLGSKCSADAEIVEITPDLRKKFCDAHNKLRNQQALGKTPGFGPAKRMATMTWDDELAELAKYTVMNCRVAHDQCRSTRMFFLAGQNLAGTGGAEVEWLAETRPANWFKEYVNANMNDIRNHTSVFGAKGKSIAHFTQIVKDDAYKVGCSIAKYTDGGGKKCLIACNYAVSNIQNWPIYDEGAPTSACQTGKNPEFAGLCSVAEVYDKPWFRTNFE